MATAKHQKPANGRRPRSRIPRFQSIEEEAEFWDTHDLTEFEAEFELVEDVHFIVTRGGPKKGITIRLDPDTFAALAHHAEQAGVRPSALVRLWVAEHVWSKSR